jgi:hypothetical protein
MLPSVEGGWLLAVGAEERLLCRAWVASLIHLDVSRTAEIMLKEVIEPRIFMNANTEATRHPISGDGGRFSAATIQARAATFIVQKKVYHVR